MKDDFEICYAHIEKAIDDINRLSTEVSNLDFSNLWSLKEIAAPPFSDRSDWVIEVSSLPPQLNVLAAGIMHNLRIPLDQMLCIYYSRINADRPIPYEISFPFSKSKLDKKINFLSKKNFSPDILNYISQLEPYQGGSGEQLWKIHMMDIASKHHGTLKAKPNAAKITFCNLGFSEGILYRVGQENGPSLVNMNPGIRGQEHMQAPSDDLRPIFREINGMRCFECAILNPELPIFRTSPGDKTVGNLSIFPDLVLVIGNEELEAYDPLKFLINAANKTTDVLDVFCKIVKNEI